MSSILKALKKLEEEYPHRVDVVSWPRKLGPTRIIRRWEIHAGRFARVLWVSLGLILLAATGWFVFYVQRPIDAEPVTAVTIPEPVPVRASPVSEFMSRSRRTASRESRHRPKNASVSTPKSRPAVTTAAETAEKRIPSSRQRPVAPQAPAPKPKGAGRELPIPDGLKLQAISWSEQQSERIAVINNEIVREGATLQGYRVLRIESERVVLRKNGDAWALAFKLQKSND